MQQSETTLIPKVRGMDISDQVISTEDAKAIAAQLNNDPNFQRLSLSQIAMEPKDYREIARPLAQHPGIRSISILFTNMGDAVEGLALALKENRIVQSVRLDFSNIGNEGARALAEALKTNPTITEFSISFNHIGEEGAKYFAEALASRTSILKSFEIRTNHVGTNGAKYFAETLPQARNLRSLCIDHNNIGDEGVIALGTILPDTALSRFSAANNNITDSGAKALVQALQTLDSLDIGENPIGDSTAIALAEALKGNKTLHVLRLYKTQIGDEGAKALAEALRGDTALGILDLSETKIGDEGAKALAEALEINNTVQEISFSGCKIGDSTAIALAEALAVNETVRSLGVTKTQIGDQGAQAFVKALEVNTTVLNFCMHGNSISTSLVNVIDAHLKANFALSGQRFPQAIAVFEKMKNEAGGDDSTTKAADEGKKKCLKIWGKKLQKDGDSQGALDKFKEALGIDPNDTTIENLKQTIIQDNHDVDDNMPGLEAPSGGAISAQELGLDAQLVGEN